MSVHLVLRLVVATIVAYVGWKVAAVASGWAPLSWGIASRYYRWVITALGGLVGYVIAPHLTTRPYNWLCVRVRKASARGLLLGVCGGGIGLVLAALLALPLSMLPGRYGSMMPAVGAVLLSFLGALILITRDKDILGILGLFVSRDGLMRRRRLVLLDTSVIIDGRVADIQQTGFIPGSMLVPRFVLSELQNIADSADVLRRNRGRRGLDILNKMQKDASIPLEISELDAQDVSEVDGKLVKLGQDLDCPLLTNDYNLNRVAELQGVQVLNINELANAVKVIVLPGEALDVQIIQQGKEPGQGVGYLDDGTMVVVEDGRRRIGSMVTISVTRVLQTVAGRMIFGQVRDARH